MADDCAAAELPLPVAVRQNRDVLVSDLAVGFGEEPSTCRLRAKHVEERRRHFGALGALRRALVTRVEAAESVQRTDSNTAGSWRRSK